MAETLPDLVRRPAARTPDAIAVRSGATEVSYADLLGRADALAARLRSHGVGTNEPVAVLHDRAVALAAALLGIMVAGGAFVPLDVEAPRARLAALVAAAGITVAVADEAHRPLLLELGLTVESVPDTPADAPDRPVDPDGLAYVIHTSGTTGRPKGVMVGHAAIVEHIAWLVDRLPLAVGDEVLQVAPVTFDAAVTDLFWPLASGATVRLLERGQHRDLAVLDEAIGQVSAVRLSPAHLAELLGPDYRMAWPDLRYLMSGGAALPASVRDGVLARLPGVRLFNRYGPTETTVVVTYGECVAGAPEVPLGPPRPGATLHVLDDQLRPAEAGELYVGGSTLAAGYLHAPDQTADVFVPDPFGPPGARMYATGDLVRTTADGDLVFVGRRDAQLKVRGIRVEPAEVETVLDRHPAVRSCAVTVVDQQLTALVVPADHAPKPAELRKFARQWLPPALLPSRIVFVNTLPHTDRGKIDRANLVALVPAPDHTPAPAADPADPKAVLAAVWTEVLGGPHTDFFDVGGHSLLATQLQARLRARLGIVLPLSVVFDHPGYADIEAAVLARNATTDQAPRRQDWDTDLRPLTFAQQRLWLIQQFDVDSVVYNFQCVLRFHGELDEPALRTTLAGIIDRHESLRSVIDTEDGMPRWRVLDAVPTSIESLDVRRYKRPYSAARAAATDFVRRPFDLARPPLLRWLLIRVGFRETWLVQSQHHLIHDGWSFNVFLAELAAGYRAAHAGRPTPREALPLQVGDVARWQQDRFVTGALDADIAHFTERLQDVPPLAWPGREVASGFAGGLLRVPMPPDTMRAIRALARRWRCSEFIAGFAVFGALVQAVTGQDDIAIGTSVANRATPEIERLIGCLLNNIAVRVRAVPAEPFDAYARRVVRELVAGYDHQDAPLQTVVAAVNPRRDGTRNPLFQVAYNYHDSRFPDVSLPGVRLSVEEALDNGTARFDLHVVVVRNAHLRDREPSEPRSDMVWRYSRGVLSDAEVARLAVAYAAIARRAAKDDTASFADVVRDVIERTGWWRCHEQAGV